MNFRNELKEIFEYDDGYSYGSSGTIAAALMHEFDDSGYSWEEFGINLKCVESNGGEGEGEDYRSTWVFQRGTEELYYTFYGYYASHHGAEYEGYYECAPKEVVVTKYVKVENKE